MKHQPINPEFDVSDLEGDLNTQVPRNKRAEKDRPKYACPHCGGTGRWSRGMNSEGNTHCFACGGRGYFLKSPSDRFKSRERRKARKQRGIEEGRAAIIAEHGQLIEDLEAIASWHRFAADLLAKFKQYGNLTEGQIKAAYKALARVEERRAERDKAKAAASGSVDMSVVSQMFTTAAGNGLKRPRFRYADLMLSLAPATGRNAGAIYVRGITGSIADEYGVPMNDYQYYGKIIKNTFHATSECPETVLPQLLEIVKNPREAAVSYGRITGNCSCCGRKLIRKDSIELGIGPICAEKWGI